MQKTAENQYSSTYKFNGWRFDSELNELHSHKNETHLEPKTAELLLFMLRNAEAVVTREKILLELWPGVIVSDDSLTQLVIKLRKALGDDSRNPKYIQTIPKRGYRFLVKPTPVHDAPRSDPSSRKIYYLFGSVITLGIAAFFWAQETSLLHTTQTVYQYPDVDLTSGGKPSIVVLPFAAAQNSAKQANLANNISTAISSDLSKLSSIWVITSNMTFNQYKNTDQETKPEARYVVTGNVQEKDGQISIFVVLIETANGRQLWSEYFNQAASELLVAQSNISHEIAQALKLKISNKENERLSQPYTQDILAYNLFTEARQNLLARRQIQNQRARDLYWLAIQRDPVFARAYAGLALSHAADYRNQWSSDLDYSLNRANELAETALEINPDIPELHWVLGYVYTQKKQHDKAIEHLTESLALHPSYADAYALLGGINTYIGQPEQSIKLLRNAIRLSHSAGSLYFLLLGRAYFYLNDTEQAIINLQEALSRNPALLEAHIYMVASYLQDGDVDKADLHAFEIEALDSGFSIDNWIQTYPMTSEKHINILISSFKSLKNNHYIQ